MKKDSDSDFEINHRAFNDLSKETQKLLVKFAEALCSTIEIYGFSFQVGLLIDTGYQLDEILRMAITLSYLLNRAILLEEKNRFQIDIEIEFYRNPVRMSFYSNGDHYEFSSKTYLNDTHELPKDKIGSYIDKIFLISNKNLLEKLRFFISQNTEGHASSGLTKIQIDEDSRVVRKVVDNHKTKSCSFRKVGSKNRRFEILVKIVRNPKIGASKLGDNLQRVSTEISDINKRLKKELSLEKDFIVNNASSGYEYDSDTYRVVFS